MSQQSVKPTGSSYTPPVAPDTSVGAFIASHPEFEGQERYLYGSPKWSWEADPHARINAAYDSWKAQLDNAYAQEMEVYKTGYDSYINQADMLEAAGYNRNWLGSAPAATPSGYSFTPSDNPRQTGNPVTSPMAFMGLAGSASNMALDLYGKLADVKLKGAQTDNLEAQAEATRNLLPFRLTKSYFDSLPEYMKWYGFGEGELSQFVPGHPEKGVTFQKPVPGSYGSQVMDYYLRFKQLENEGKDLANQFQSLSNSEKSYLLQHIQPLQKIYLRGQIALSAAYRKAAIAQANFSDTQSGYWYAQHQMLSVEQERRKLAKEMEEEKLRIFKEYGMNEAQQRYINNWINTGLNAVKTGVYTYGTFATGGASAGLSIPAFSDEFSSFSNQPW